MGCLHTASDFWGGGGVYANMTELVCYIKNWLYLTIFAERGVEAFDVVCEQTP